MRRPSLSSFFLSFALVQLVKFTHSVKIDIEIEDDQSYNNCFIHDDHEKAAI